MLFCIFEIELKWFIHIVVSPFLEMLCEKYICLWNVQEWRESHCTIYCAVSIICIKKIQMLNNVIFFKLKHYP